MLVKLTPGGTIVKLMFVTLISEFFESPHDVPVEETKGKERKVVERRSGRQIVLKFFFLRHVWSNFQWTTL
jgi:hypothetical protein